MKELSATVLDPTHLELSEPLTAQPGVALRILIDAGEIEDRRIQSSLREREISWCRDHPELLAPFAGRWIVVEGEEVVGDGSTPQQAVDQARAKGIGVPFVFFVESIEPEAVRLGI